MRCIKCTCIETLIGFFMPAEQKFVTLYETIYESYNLQIFMVSLIMKTFRRFARLRRSRRVFVVSSGTFIVTAAAIVVVVSATTVNENCLKISKIRFGQSTHRAGLR